MTVSEDHRFKPFNFKPFETDRWFRFRVHYVEVLSEAKYRKHRRAVLVVFVVLELNRKAEFRLDFSAGWTPVSRDKRVLKALGISLPLPLEVDWKRLLEGRLMQGRFGPPSEPGARNKLQDARPYSACAQARASSVIAVSPGIILTENGQAHPLVLRAPTVSVELRIDALRDKRPSRQRVARLVGVGSRFKDIDRPIGIRELFFLRLLSGTKQVRSESRQGRTSVSESDAVDEFDYWVKLGLITFNKGKIGRKQEEEGLHTRLTKSWNGFKAQMGSISRTLGVLFDAEWLDSTSKVYSIGLVPGAVEDRLCDSAILSAELRSTRLR